jgi:CBS domain containing-hemolysin-like protein
MVASSCGTISSNMSFALTILLLFIAAVFVVVTAMYPRRSGLNDFERARSETDEAQEDLRREKYHRDISTLRRLLQAVLLILFTATAIAVYGFGEGILVAVVLALLAVPVANMTVINRYANKLYAEQEKRLLNTLVHYAKYLKWLRPYEPKQPPTAIHSVEELAHTIETTKIVRDEKQRRLLKNALTFHDRTVAEVMTPRDKLVTIKKTEILGPLVLDDLFKTGHQSFPVTNGDPDGVVGVLRLSDVSTLDTTRKHTAMAETAMRRTVHTVAPNLSLADALEKLLKSQEHIVIVSDDDKTVVGLLTLSDIMRELLER